MDRSVGVERGVRSACEDITMHIDSIVTEMWSPEDREMNRAMRNEEMLPGDRMEEIIKEKSMVGPGG